MLERGRERDFLPLDLVQNYFCPDRSRPRLMSEYNHIQLSISVSLILKEKTYLYIFLQRLHTYMSRHVQNLAAITPISHVYSFTSKFRK